MRREDAVLEAHIEVLEVDEEQVLGPVRCRDSRCCALLVGRESVRLRALMPGSEALFLVEVGAAHRHVRIVRELGRRVAAVELVAVDDGVHVDLRQLRRLITAADRVVAALLVREVSPPADGNALLA